MFNVIFMPDLFSLRIFKLIVNNLHRKHFHLYYHHITIFQISSWTTRFINNRYVVILQTQWTKFLVSNFQDSGLFVSIKLEWKLTGVVYHKWHFLKISTSSETHDQSLMNVCENGHWILVSIPHVYLRHHFIWCHLINKDAQYFLS